MLSVGLLNFILNFERLRICLDHGALKIAQRIWGHGLWKSLCTNSNHNPFLGHCVVIWGVTTPKYWTFKTYRSTNSTNPTLEKYASPRIEAKKNAWNRKGDNASGFHLVSTMSMYVDLFFEPRSVEVSLTQTFYDTTPNQPWRPGCNHERSKC